MICLFFYNLFQFLQMSIQFSHGQFDQIPTLASFTLVDRRERTILPTFRDQIRLCFFGFLPTDGCVITKD